MGDYADMALIGGGFCCLCTEELIDDELTMCEICVAKLSKKEAKEHGVMKEWNKVRRKERQDRQREKLLAEQENMKGNSDE